MSEEEKEESRYIPKTLVSISIVTAPNKTSYIEGEYVNLTGIVVQANYSNGTHQTITTYFYSPQVALTLSDTQITISYSGKTAYQPITVSIANRLVIDNPPYKTTYKVGDYFESFDLVVKFRSGDGTSSQVVTDYSLTPTGPLTTSNTAIFISYNGYSTTYPITVIDTSTIGYFPKQNIIGSNLGDNPFYNLFDQSIRFISDTISVSRDSYTLSFNLVYHSRMQDRLSSLINGLPSRFKTNYHQYLIQDGVDENNNDIYKYIDGDSYIHTFYKMKERLYYCRDSGLYLFFEQNNDDYAKIVDSNKNEFYFDEDSRLIKIKSGIDSTNIKHIIYSNGYISRIYDQRDSTTEISFSYGNSMMSGVSFIYRGATIKSLAFTYSNDIETLLINVTELGQNNHSRILYSFSYNNGASGYSSFNRIEYLTDCLNCQVYFFSYFYNSYLDDYCTNCFQKGCFINSPFVCKEEIECASFLARSGIHKSVQETTLKNQNNQYFKYFLDRGGHIVSCFECGGANSTVFKTIYKESGRYIDIGGSESTTINSHGFVTVNGSYSFGFSRSYLNDFKHFVLKMYVKINNCSLNRVKIKLSNSYIMSSPVSIDEEQFDGIIPIEIPFSKVLILTNMVTFALSFTDENNDNVNVEIANLYIDKKERKMLFFESGDNFFENVERIKLYNQPYGTPIEYDNGEYPYFTESDFLNSLLSIYKYGDLTCDGSSILFLANGKCFVTYLVSFVLMNQNDINFFISAQLSNQSWGFLTNSPDGKTVSKTYYNFYSSYYEILTETVFNDDESTAQTEKRKYSYNNVLQEITNSHIDNNQTISSVTSFEYFQNGELKKVSSSCNNETIIVYEASIDNNGYISRKTSGLNSVDIEYQQYLENTIYKNAVNNGNISRSLYKKSIDYNQCFDKLSSVTFLHNNVNNVVHSQETNITNNETTLCLNNLLAYRISNNNQTDTTTFYRHDSVFGFQNTLSVHKTDASFDKTFYVDSSTNVVISNSFNLFKKIINQKLNNIEKVTFTYENNIEPSFTDNLVTVIDRYLDNEGKITTYYYDSNYGDLCEINFDDDAFSIEFNNATGQIEYCFDAPLNEGMIIQQSYNQTIYSFTYYHTNNQPVRVFSIKKDGFNRVAKASYEHHDDFWYLSCRSYFSNSNLVSSYCFGSSSGNYNINSTIYNESYVYDQYGNLSSISINNVSNSRSYSYDGFGRLIQETNSSVDNYNRIYSYYCDGKMEYFGNNHLVYNSKGQLNSFGSVYFTYDQYGNRLTKGNNTYTYERGNLLSSITKNNNLTTFKYDYLGRRFQKNSCGIITSYFYHDDKLIAEVRSDGIKLLFLYSDEGIVGFCKCDSTSEAFYYYVKNPFGLITHIVDESNTVVAIYQYDAWGNHVAISPQYQQEDIANLNPIRYKGYYYDNETELYYLKSRYYDASVGQFISPDDCSYLTISSISGYNLYAYCSNNPVMHVDPDGHSWISFVATVVIGGVVGFASAAYQDYSADKKWFNGKWEDYLFEISLGAVSGFLGAFVPAGHFFIGAGASAAIGAASEVISDYYYGNLTICNSRWFEVIQSAIKGAALSSFSYSITYAVSYYMAKWHYQRIIGSANNHYHINRALRAAGIHKKIGQVGYNGIIQIILKRDYSSIFGNAFSGFLDLFLELFL